MFVIHQYTEADKNNWDAYVHAHPKATLYHLSGWKNVIENTYGHKTYYLLAIRPKSCALNPQPNSAYHGNSNDEKLGSWEAERLGSFEASDKQSATHNPQPTTDKGQPTPATPVGILPLVHLKHILFGNNLISIPFFDMGGILADDEETEIALVNAAIILAQKLGAKNIELRNQQPIKCLKLNGNIQRSLNFEQSIDVNPESSITRDDNHGLDISFRRRRVGFSQFPPEIEKKGKSRKSRKSCLKKNDRNESISFTTKSHKVRMLLGLPDSSEALMDSFKSKLRSQIKKPIKEGLKAKIGGAELINDFYEVFAVNMRDLGSPVHSKTLFRNVLQELQGNTKIVILYKGHEPAACSLIIGFKDTLENPWASSLREFSRLAPNMLLYWTMLEYACNNGFKFFDFGRSTPGEGTYRFKAQWGAIPERLHWQYVSFAKEYIENGKSSKDKYSKLVPLWKNLPVPITKIIGPPIRKHIGL